MVFTLHSLILTHTPAVCVLGLRSQSPFAAGWLLTCLCSPVRNLAWFFECTWSLAFSQDAQGCPSAHGLSLIWTCPPLTTPSLLHHSFVPVLSPLLQPESLRESLVFQLLSLSLPTAQYPRGEEGICDVSIIQSSVGGKFTQ